VESAPRAYRLKASNAAPPISTLPGTIPDAPALREYRYTHRENRTYLVDPGERTVIEEID
jgi:hypothetical protein